MSKVSHVSIIGCLMYDMVCTRPDLAPIISHIYKFMSKSGNHHWKAIKWIFRHLKGRKGHGSVFRSEHGDPSIIGYVKSNYASDMDDRRSTTRYVFNLARGHIYKKHQFNP